MQLHARTALKAIPRLAPVFLYGCTSLTSTADRQIEPTQSDIPRVSFTSTATVQPTSAATRRSAAPTATALEPIEASRATRVPTAVPTLITPYPLEFDFGQVPPLKEIVLTTQDFQDTSLGVVHFAFYRKAISGVEQPLGPFSPCEQDEVQIIWTDSDLAELSVTLVRASSIDCALQRVDVLWHAFGALEDLAGSVLYLDEYHGPGDPKWAAYKWHVWEATVMEKTVVVNLRLRLKVEREIDDLGTLFELSLLGQIQLDKLAQAGYP